MKINKTLSNVEGFQPKKKKRKNKLVITFDENDRREFLTGFRKRKLQRKKKAMEEFEQQLKSERKRIKNESREAYKKLLLQHKPIPELNLHSEEIDMGTHSVSVTELSAAELAKSNNWIGLNEVQYENDQDVFQSDNDSELEGMDVENKNFGESSLKNCRDIKKAIKKQATLTVKNSKIFQKKTRIETKKHIKKKKKEERKRKKLKQQKIRNET